jgi:hypothetical protein
MMTGNKKYPLDSKIYETNCDLSGKNYQFKMDIKGRVTEMRCSNYIENPDYDPRLKKEKILLDIFVK